MTEKTTEILADYYYQNSRAESTDTSAMCLPTKAQDSYEEINNDITTTEIEAVIRNLKNTSPGPDSIHAATLKHLSHENVIHI